MFENIARAAAPRKLTAEQEAENYAAFQRLMEEGVSLPDLIRRAETSSQTPAELLPVMEAAVADDPDVASARAEVEACRARVLDALCARDDGFRAAMETYRQTVTKAYIRAREAPKRAEGIESR